MFVMRIFEHESEHSQCRLSTGPLLKWQALASCNAYKYLHTSFFIDHIYY